MRNSDLVNDIANADNLMLAWRKLEGEVSRQDDWCDIMEFYAYKFQLKDKLADLQQRLKEGTYVMQKIRPLPFPKGPKVKEDGKIEKTRVRQYFHVAIEDHLVWIAYCNVIAQYAERRMPGWSYGNRTDVRVWYYEDQGKRVLQVGNYRNTRNSIYKAWNHTWPLYRKLLALTIKMMSRNKQIKDSESVDWNEEELQLINDNANSNEQKLPYLEEGYFKDLDGEQLYWAGIDIEKFYPNIDRELIKENLKNVIYDDRQSKEFLKLTDALLDFKIDVTGFTAEELAEMEIDPSGEYAKGIPTGLLMAGFLSNLALLGIDEIVRERLRGNHKIAHFRYVDDHVILAQDKQALVDWVKSYTDLLTSKGFTVNNDKTEPETLANILRGEGKVEELKGLDPIYPSPLMTITLQKVSQMADLNVEQLSNTEFDMVFADLQELLILDIPDQEIKKETRISFAVTMLSRILVHGDVDYEELGRLKQEIRKELEKNALIGKDEWQNWFYRDDKYPAIPALADEVKRRKLSVAEAKSNQVNSLIEAAEANKERKHRYIYELIVRAIEDVPERTRIWIRMLQYCYKHKPELVKGVFGLLEKNATRIRLHPMDIDYLRMMLLNKLAQLLMFDMTNDEHKERYEKGKKLLTEIYGKINRNKSRERYFEAETYLYVENVVGLEQMVSMKTEKPISETVLYNGETVDVDFWLLYYLQFSDLMADDEKPVERAAFIEQVTHDSKYYPALFLKCMRHKQFQEDALRDATMDENLVNYIKRHHLLTDVYRIFCKPYREKIASFLDITEVEKDRGEYVTLSDWIFKVAEEHGDLLHTEHLEYVALKIVHSIAETIDECHRDLFNFTTQRYVNLFNLCVKKETLTRIGDQDWWDGAEKLTKYEQALSEVSRFPLEQKMFPDEYNDVYDIAVMLLQILTLNQLSSDYLVDAEYGFKWEGIVKRLMGQGYMSFYTYMILMGCLSKRNRETRLFRRSGMSGVREDDGLDAPVIFSLEELMHHIGNALMLLKQNRVSLPDHKYRTLSVVSLENYKKFEDKVENGEETKPEELEEYLKVDIIQTNLDHRQAWSGLAKRGYAITESEMKKCWSEIVMYFKQIMDMEKATRPQIVVLPEFAFDKGYYRQLKTLSTKAGCLVIAGRNFVEVEGRQLMNKAVVLVPCKWPNGSGNTSTPDFEFGKYFFAQVEEKFIRKIGYSPKRYDKMYLLDGGRYGNMGLAICADFYDIERFAIYRGKIQHLLIIAYNKDVKSFYYLAEAISRIVFCNVVICNTGFYGGSIAFSPYEKDYKRYVYKHEGGNLYTNQIVLLPVRGLFKAQNKLDDRLFKSVPPGYKYLGLNFEKKKKDNKN